MFYKEKKYKLLTSFNKKIRFFSYPLNLYRFLKYSFLRISRTNFNELLEKIFIKDRNEFVMFLTDDSYFFKPVTLEDEIFDIISSNPSYHSFSLRLGCNIKYKPRNMKRIQNYWTWDFYGKDSIKDFAYPFSLDGVIYYSEFIYSLLRKILYTNPNSLEAFVVRYVIEHKLLRKGFCFSNSVLMSLPINRVQQIVQNQSLGISEMVLNKKFLEGYTLSYEFSENIGLPQIYPDKIILKKGEHIEVLYKRRDIKF